MRFVAAPALALLVLLSSGCSTLVPVPEVPREAASIDPHEAWRSVLHDHVDDTGRVNFKAIAKSPAKLKAFVNWISKHGPKAQPEEYKTNEKKLAYYLNSYNALSMYNIIDSEIPESLSGLKKVKFFYFKKFIIAGEEMSLYAYENDVIRKMQDERVHFALNCMSKGCPRLPRKPFTAEKLNEELDAGAKLFFSEERNVRVDRAEKVVWISEILDFFPDDFKRKAPNAAAYANRWRKEKVPEDYKIKFIPYDWGVNAQPEAKDSKSLSNEAQSESGSKS